MESNGPPLDQWRSALARAWSSVEEGTFETQGDTAVREAELLLVLARKLKGQVDYNGCPYCGHPVNSGPCQMSHP